MPNQEYILKRLAMNKFRSSFHLKESDIAYIDKLGFDKIKDHAYEFIIKRLASDNILNDGKHDLWFYQSNMQQQLVVEAV